jgi:hypothetical protein
MGRAIIRSVFLKTISQWNEGDEHPCKDFKLTGNIIIHKVSKTQHQNLEFGHTQGEIQRKPAKKYISNSTWDETQKTINFGGKLSFILSFLFPKRLHRCYIYFHWS